MSRWTFPCVSAAETLRSSGPHYAERAFMHVPMAALNEDHGSAVWRNDVRAAGKGTDIDSISACIAERT